MKTYEKLFDILSQADDFINGEKIAQELGISRTSVWKAIQKLEKEGIQIESIKNRGYRLISGDLLIPAWIESQSPLNEVSFNPDCQSTQLDAKTGIEAGKPANSTLPLHNQLDVAVSAANSFVQTKAAFT